MPAAVASRWVLLQPAVREAAIVVMAIPGIHLLVSLWRMRNEVEGRFLPPKIGNGG